MNQSAVLAVQPIDPDDLPSFVRVGTPSLLNASWPSAFCADSTGDRSSDWAIGTALANEAIRFCRSKNSNAAIVFAIAEIGRRGEFNWIETAFLERLANAARAGVMN